MRTNGVRKKVGALLAAAILGCATYVYAQADVSAPVSTSANRNRPDSELVRDVRRAFTRTSGLNSSGIHVTARNGIVTLTGWVPQRSQIARAGNAARSVRGVRSVSNRLTLRTGRGSGR